MEDTILDMAVDSPYAFFHVFLGHTVYDYTATFL